MAPILLIAPAFIAAEILERRDPGKATRAAEEEAERQLDAILDS
jgi:hypothetical protein